MGFELCKFVLAKGARNTPAASFDKNGQLTLSRKAAELAGINSARFVQFYYDKRERLLGIATPDKAGDFTTPLERRKAKNIYAIGPMLQGFGLELATVKGRYRVRREKDHFLALIIDLNKKL